MKLKLKLVIGLVGQVCAGKSAVANAFWRRGARVWNADQAVHVIYRNPKVINQIVQLFGSKVLNLEGDIDRQALAKIVFSSSAQLKKLTCQVVFPRTGRILRDEVKRFRATQSPVTALVLDAPTLFESGHNELCDYIVFVSAPLKRRLKWANARGWDRAELKRREQYLGNASLKRRQADVIIRNDGSLQDLDRRVERILTRWGVKQVSDPPAKGSSARKAESQ
ncbi:MAG: dephospho-CoA kinase [Planctomycetota bacterium]